MRFISVRAALVPLCACLIHPTVAEADNTGMASMHDWQKVGRKTCFEEHYHSGSGEGRTKRDARRAAIIDWENFTAFEYGTDWARFRSAASRGIRYDKGPDGWAASVEGRPCKR
jgi:hypothetical protein